MAVATPELERERQDQIHNDRIREIYARLIMPETKMSDIRAAAPVQQAYVQPTQISETAQQAIRVEEHVEQVMPVQQVAQAAAPTQYESRFVEGARTSEALFRADSAINRQTAYVQAEAQPVVVAQPIEEESEDERPTLTTMQYTARNQAVEVQSEVEHTQFKSHISLSKRDKVVIAVVVSIIVALFAMIIVNSAIISNLNSDLNSLQTSLNTARGEYQRVTDEIADYESNFDETLKNIAENLGMVR